MTAQWFFYWLAWAQWPVLIALQIHMLRFHDLFEPAPLTTVSEDYLIGTAWRR